MEEYSSAPRGGEFVVEGGHRIGGTIVPSGNKNEALPVLSAALLCPGPFVVGNVPKIRDVATLLEILKHIDVGVEATGDHELTLDSKGLSGHDLDPQLAQTIRGSFLLAPGLLHRHGRAVLPKPGGDKIGRRRLDTHLLALKQLGADVKVNGAYELTLKGRFRAADIFLDEASVMATENAVMAAAVARGTSSILNAAWACATGMARTAARTSGSMSGTGSG